MFRIFCPGNQNSNKPITECPFLSQFLSPEDVPSFLGGGCNCPGGCIAGVPNSQTAPIEDIDADGNTCVSVSARSTRSVEIPVKKGMALKYALRVEDRKIEISAKFNENAASTSTYFMDKKFLTSEQGALNGTFTPSQDGYCIFVFDNTHSILRSKKVFYKVEFENE